jgi:2-isopropylmalate synthase
MIEQDVIYDWNLKGHTVRPPIRKVQVHDETLRDGIQSPSISDPSLDHKMEIVRLMDRCGVDSVDVGLPGAGKRATEDSQRLVEMIRDEDLKIIPGCAARTVRADIDPIIEISQKTGVQLEAMMFLGTSPIRMYAEAWTEKRLEEFTRSAMRTAVRGGLKASFVTEDTTRAHPRTLRRLFTAAVEEGATRLVICDTVGHAWPTGVHNLVHWVRDMLIGLGVEDEVALDWHGHDDRGFALINALAAIEAGVDRVHGTVLGIGERVGNTSLDHLLVNLRLLGIETGDLSALGELCELCAKACNWPIKPDYPVFGRDAFRTGTGVHAAAVIKAEAKGDQWLADRVYSGVPASWFGRRQEITIGFMSGVSNVKYWLRSRDIEPNEHMVKAILDRAKSTTTVLTDTEIHEVVATCK